MILQQIVGVGLLALGGLFGYQAVRSTMRSMADNINIVAAPQRRVKINLVGQEYMAKVPKKALALSLMTRMKNVGEDPALAKETLDALIVKMLGRDQVEGIHARFEDENDELDIDHILNLMNALIELGTDGDPTT